MTALGGLDGLGPVAPATRSSSWRSGTDPSLMDALSGPDGTADPAPWPADTGGLTAVGDVFPDALTTDLRPRSAPPTPPLRVPQAMREVAAAAGAELRAAAPSGALPNTRAPQNARAPGPQRPAQNSWSTSGGRGGQNVPRQAPPAARRTPAPARTAPTAPARPSYGSGSTGWSPGGPQSARDLLRMAREAGGLGLAATPFLRTGDRPAADTRASDTRATRPSGQPARASGQRSQWGSQQPPRPARSTDPRVRRRSSGSAVFAIFVLAVVILFASGGAQAIIHLLTTLSGR